MQALNTLNSFIEPLEKMQLDDIEKMLRRVENQINMEVLLRELKTRGLNPWWEKLKIEKS